MGRVERGRMGWVAGLMRMRIKRVLQERVMLTPPIMTISSLISCGFSANAVYIVHWCCVQGPGLNHVR